MRYTVCGRSYEIRALDPQLDELFPRLHAAYLGAIAFPWNEMHEAARTYLSRVGSAPDPDQHNAYFENFTIVWRYLLAAGSFDEAEGLWEMALKPALEVERAGKGQRIHKGTPYYFWGITAILRGDIDKGYALVHQAVEEDVATGNTDFPHNPAYALVTLNFEKLDQAFRPWVVKQAQYLKTRQEVYSAEYARQFTLEDFRTRFLNSPPNRDVAFLFVYTVARLMRLSTVPQYCMQSSFMGQLLINLFFDITLCIESAASAKNPSSGTFITHAEFIASRARHPMSNKDLGDINKRFNQDFNGTLNLALDRRLPLLSGRNADKAQSDISVAYGIRNRAAHDVSSAPIVWQKRDEIEQALLNVMFMTVDFV